MYDLIEQIGMNSYTWGGPWPIPKPAGVHSVDVLIAMKSILAPVTDQKFGNLNLWPTQMLPQQVLFCDFYDVGQTDHECPNMGTLVQHADFT